ncbi:MAG TPA: GEVED domain-containing protein [Bacteroidia bacterium]|nr:GEVED domain-containing protein [Bacteroidia bacterium]
MKRVLSQPLQTKGLLSLRYFLAFFVFTFFIGSSFDASAQTTIRENFEGSVFPPFGWTQGKGVGGTDPENYWERVGNPSGSTPSINAHSGSGHARYRSRFMANAGENAYLSTPKLDMTNIPGGGTQVRFSMYRDASSNIWDSLTVFVSNTPNPGGATRLGMIPRYYNYAPTATLNTWNRYTFTIPNSFNNSSVYVIFQGTNRSASAATGANIHIDSVEVDTWPKNQTYVSSELIFQETADVGKATINEVIVGVRIVTDGGANRIRLDSLLFNPTGTSLLSDITNARVWWTKGTNQSVVSAGNQFGGTVAAPNFTNMRFAGPGVGFFLENGENYFWVSYDIPAGAVSGNCVDVDLGAPGGLNNGIVYRPGPAYAVWTYPVPNAQSLLGCRLIDISYCIPSMSTGTSWLNGSYTNNDYVARVALKGEAFSTPGYDFIDNNQNCCGPPIAPYFGGPAPFSAHPPDYEQFSPGPLKTATLKVNTNYAAGANPGAVGTGGAGISMQVGTWSSSNYVAAWIDYNKNGSLADAGEKIAQSTGLAANGWFNAGFTVPLAATIGTTRLRVREVFAQSNIQPCNNYTFGETEDYKVSIIPQCPAGVKTWLGFTNDWNVPGNWCGGVPTISDIALIQFASSGTPASAYNSPVIKAGTMATARRIRLAAGDSLTMDAHKNSTLTVRDSLNIGFNTPGGGNALLRVISNFNDTAQISNGTLPFQITPFRSNRRNQKMQIIYTPTDFSSRGMIAGDVIDTLAFHIFSKTSFPGWTLNNFTVNVANLSVAGWVWPAVPLSLAPTGAWTNVYSGAVTLPGPPANYTFYLPLIANSFIWDGVSSVVVEFCFDNTIAGTSGFSGDLMAQTQTAGARRTMFIENASAPGGCTLNWPLSPGNTAQSTEYRPNITFHFRRPYDKYNINMIDTAQWINNGIFQPAISRVNFTGATQTQHIMGARPTSFYDLRIAKGAASVARQLVGATVTDSLILQSGQYDLNQLDLTVTNPATSAITYTTGYLFSETAPPAAYGRVRKYVGTTLGTHVIPFGNAAGNLLPFSYDQTAGDGDTITASTFTTAANNTPYPYNVVHMRDLGTGTDLSVPNVVDRFWELRKSGATGVGTLTFVHANGERPSCCGGNNTLKPQRWLNPNGNGLPGWEVLPNASAHTYVTNNISITAISAMNGPWTLSNILQPLPVQLINYQAELINDKVKLFWSVASEYNMESYLIERSQDLNNFTFIDKVASLGNSTTLRDYYTFDYNPLAGLQYYKLTAFENDGGIAYTGIVPIKVGRDTKFEISSVHSNYQSGLLDVIFTYNSNEAYKYSVVDVLGRTLYSKDKNAASEGLNTLQINVNMSSGIYFLLLENSKEKSTYKFTY